MKFDEALEQFVFEYNGLIFAWDEEPDGDYMERVKAISEKFHAQLDSIRGLMMPDIIEVFGDFSVDEVKERLGKPVIDCDNGQVNYFEQSFEAWCKILCKRNSTKSRRGAMKSAQSAG